MFNLISTALLGGVLVKSVIYSEESNSADAASVLRDQDQKDTTFENERFRGEMKYLVKMLDNKGALDVEL